jgi:light-regulated signal transduction histidine kinase (bacteriophytochrome)
LNFVIGGAKRMEMLVADLLTYTQIAASGGEGAELVDAGKVLQRVLENLKTSIDDRDATVTATDLPLVRMHDVHLLQILQNLVGNALKYSSNDRQCEIRISAESGPDFATIHVQDNGIGIPAQYTMQVFGLFRRLHNSDEYSGTGIGLAICQRLVERYGGKIWVESVVDQGSCFNFRLPA